MKRTRAVATPDPPARPQKRPKAAAAGKPKPRKADGKGPTTNQATAVESSPPAAPPSQPVDAQLGFEGLCDNGWWWGVEEEMFLGWFPFVDDDFPCSRTEEGAGPFWELDHDIWQLQHIHEIPNQAK